MVPVNYLTILIAAIESMVIGFLWYGPVFGKTWMKEMGWSKDKLEKSKPSSQEMNKLYGIQAVASLFMAFVLAHALVFASSYLNTSGVSAGLQTGFWNWLGFIAPVTLGSVLWEGKSWKLWCLNNAYHLTTLLVMGVTLSLFS